MAPGLYTGVQDGNKLVKMVQRGDAEQTQTHWRLPVAPRPPRLRSIRELQRHQRRRCDDDERARRSMCDALRHCLEGAPPQTVFLERGNEHILLANHVRRSAFVCEDYCDRAIFKQPACERAFFFFPFFFLPFFLGQARCQFSLEAAGGSHTF